MKGYENILSRKLTFQNGCKGMHTWAQQQQKDNSASRSRKWWYSVRHIINSVMADSQMVLFNGRCNLSPECNNILCLFSWTTYASVKLSGSHSTDLQVSQQSLVPRNWIWRSYLLATSSNGQCHSWRDQPHRTRPRWWVVHHRQRRSTNEFLTSPLQRLQSALRRAGSLKESFRISNLIKCNNNCDNTVWFQSSDLY